MKELKKKMKVLLGLLLFFGFGFLIGAGISKLVKGNDSKSEASSLWEKTGTSTPMFTYF